MPPKRQNTDGALPPSKKKKTLLTSWVWNHGEKITENGHEYWCSNRRPKGNPVRYIVGGTSNQTGHLFKVHGITKEGKLPTSQRTIEATMGTASDIIEATEIRKAVIKWIIDRRHAFNEVEAQSFRDMIGSVSI